MKYRYTRFEADDLEGLDLEDLVAKLSDLLLASGYDDPYAEPGEGHSAQDLADAILEGKAAYAEKNASRVDKEAEAPEVTVSLISTEGDEEVSIAPKAPAVAQTPVVVQAPTAAAE